MHGRGTVAFYGMILDEDSKISAAEEGEARREGAEVLKEMSRSPTIQKSRTGDSAPEEETPKPPPDENGHTSNSLPKGAGSSASSWQPSFMLMKRNIQMQSVLSMTGRPDVFLLSWHWQASEQKVCTFSGLKWDLQACDGAVVMHWMKKVDLAGLCIGGDGSLSPRAKASGLRVSNSHAMMHSVQMKHCPWWHLRDAV